MKWAFQKAVHSWQIAPSEFWKMKPRHFWYLLEVERNKDKAAGKLTGKDARHLRKWMDSYNGRSTANRSQGNG